jgi:hypothetical protein
METYVKIRCSEAQKQVWEKASGLQSVSTWARDQLDVAAAGVLKTPRELELERAASPELCRHGLVNCRVCGMWVYADAGLG